MTSLDLKQRDLWDGAWTIRWRSGFIHLGCDDRTRLVAWLDDCIERTCNLHWPASSYHLEIADLLGRPIEIIHHHPGDPAWTIASHRKPILSVPSDVLMNTIDRDDIIRDIIRYEA